MSLQAETGERRESAAPRITSRSVWFSDTAWLIYLALTTVVVHLITGGSLVFIATNSRPSKTRAISPGDTSRIRR